MSYTGINPPISINNIEYGWNSITTSISGLVLDSLTAINYGITQNSENLYGRGGLPYAAGFGNREFSASITIGKKEYFSLLISAQQQGYNSILDLPFFDITVIYQVGASFKKDVIQGCRFTSDNSDSAQGDTRLNITLDILPSNIVRG